MTQYTVFVTGANRGLGLEFVRQYASDNWRVLASCRNLIQAKELQQLAHYFGNIDLLQLDVTNSFQLQHISEKYAGCHIDLLINNAGIYDDEDPLGYVQPEQMKHAFYTNSIAPLKVTEALLPSVTQSHLKTIVAISSKLGSIGENHSGGAYGYRASKAALNMVMKNLAVDLNNKNIKVFTIDPGSVKTGIGGTNASITVDQSVTNMRTLISKLTEKESGSFYDYLGNKLNW